MVGDSTPQSQRQPAPTARLAPFAFAFAVISTAAFCAIYLWEPENLWSAPDKIGYALRWVLPWFFVGQMSALVGWILFWIMFYDSGIRLFRRPLMLASLFFLLPSVFFLVRMLYAIVNAVILSLMRYERLTDTVLFTDLDQPD
ncbi:MAG: hypothetical protein O7H41_20210 [Planctomycetota bacterium]|nr:hypothetical protein [Planctomycetota bacterium]